MVARLEPDALIGGRYKLRRHIAQGGMAEVWLAIDSQLEREVAIKVLKEQIATDPIVVTRFRNEANALARLKHANIVGIHDIVSDDDRLFLVMEYIHGKSLRETLDELAARSPDHKGRLSPELTVHIGRSIAMALHHAHQRDFLHRDIKPGNILLQSDGTVLLTDFGIAKEIGVTGNDLTNDNIMMGTAKYLSPELVQGRDLTQRSDLYALGVVLYECLAGDAPFLGRNDPEIAMNRLRSDATPLNKRAPNVPPALTQVIHKMLERKPEHRYENGTDVSNALQAALAGSPDAPTPPIGGADRRGNAFSTRPTQLDPLMPVVAPTPPKTTRPTRSAKPSTASSSSRTRDHTPKKTVVPARALPSDRQSSTRRGLIPIALLLAAALVMGVVLWNKTQSPSPTIPEGDDSSTASSVAVVSFLSYDPNGEDKMENAASVPLLFDGNENTIWTTTCYLNKYFGSKRGVGIVMRLSKASTGQVSVSMQNAPYAIEVYTSNVIPDTLGAWGERAGKTFSTRPGVAQVTIDTAGEYVLVLFTEVGKSEGCSNRYPYRGEVSTIQFSPG